MSRLFSTIGKKLFQYGLVLFVAITINFVLPRFAPGDPLLYFFDESTLKELTDLQKEEVLASVGLGGSLWEQYITYIKGIFTWDLGTSIKQALPVTEIIADKLPWTITLILPALMLSTLIGITLGAYSAWNRGKGRDVTLLTTMLTFQAVPGFWIGMLFLALFSVQFGWFPTYGALSIVQEDTFLGFIKDVLWHLVLPVATLSVATVGSNYLLTRLSMLESLGQDYVTMAEAKGVRKKRLIFNHGLRNALLPIYTQFTLALGSLIGGSVIVETVFSYPGVGRLLYESVVARDFPMMQGIFLIITFGVIGANILADLTYPLIDPRAKQKVSGKEG